MGTSMGAVELITVRELSQKTTEVIRRIRASGKPAVLTSNGRAIMVLTPLDESTYAEHIAKLVQDAMGASVEPAPAVQPPGQLVLLTAPTQEHAPTRTAQTLVGEWIAACRVRPPGRVIGQVSKQIAEMLDEGLPYEAVRRGFGEWFRRGLNASQLPAIVHEANNKPVGYGAASRKAAGWIELGKAMDERRGAWATADSDFGVRRPVLEPGFGDAGGVE